MIRDRKSRVIQMLNLQCKAELDRLRNDMGRLNDRLERTREKIDVETSQVANERAQLRQYLTSQVVDVPRYQRTSETLKYRQFGIEKLRSLEAEQLAQADALRADISAQKVREKKLDQLDRENTAFAKLTAEGKESLDVQDLWSSVVAL